MPPEIVRLVHIHLLGRRERDDDVLLKLEDLVRLELEQGVFGGPRGLVVHCDFDFVEERFVEDWEGGQRQRAGYKSDGWSNCSDDSYSDYSDRDRVGGGSGSGAGSVNGKVELGAGASRCRTHGRHPR